MEQQEQEILKTLEMDMKNLKDPIKETLTEIVKQGYSKHPVMLAHMEEISIADKIIDRELFNTAFHFSATTLEALVEKGIILKEKEDEFQAQMAIAGNAVCVLLVHPELMRFIFVPL